MIGDKSMAKESSNDKLTEEECGCLIHQRIRKFGLYKGLMFI